MDNSGVATFTWTVNLVCQAAGFIRRIAYSLPGILQCLPGTKAIGFIGTVAEQSGTVCENVAG